MVIVLSKKTDLTKLKKKLIQATSKKRIGDKRKLFGTIKWDIDPLKYQKALRDEWS